MRVEQTLRTSETSFESETNLETYRVPSKQEVLQKPDVQDQHEESHEMEKKMPINERDLQTAETRQEVPPLPTTATIPPAAANSTIIKSKVSDHVTVEQRHKRLRETIHSEAEESKTPRMQEYLEEKSQAAYVLPTSYETKTVPSEAEQVSQHVQKIKPKEKEITLKKDMKLKIKGIWLNTNVTSLKLWLVLCRNACRVGKRNSYNSFMIFFLCMQSCFAKSFIFTGRYKG